MLEDNELEGIFKELGLQVRNKIKQKGELTKEDSKRIFTPGITAYMKSGLLMQRIDGEIILKNFVEKDLVGYLKKNYGDIKLSYSHKVEARCKECSNLGVIIKKQEEFLSDITLRHKIDEGSYNTKCEKCGKNILKIISTVNIFEINSKSSPIIEIGARVKGERLIDKLCYRILIGESINLVDYYGLGIITKKQKDFDYVIDGLAKILNNNIHTINQKRDEKINSNRVTKEFKQSIIKKGLDDKDFSAKPKFSAMKLKYPHFIFDASGHLHRYIFSVRIQDKLSYDHSEKNKEISHPRYIERKNAERKLQLKNSGLLDSYDILLEYTKPISALEL